jgi:Zn-dependent protease
MTQTTADLCPNCRAPLFPQDLACGQCGHFRHRPRLEQLAAEATAYEPHDPLRAAQVWRECLSLLPHNSQQYDLLRQRIGMLTSGLGNTPRLQYESRTHPATPQDDPLGQALLKTAGSMLLSIVVYSWMFGWMFATGFVLLILIHELGHVIANRLYGIKSSPPIFIPFLGAIINLRQSPPNAKVEAVVGIGGPVLGTLGALAVYLYWLQVGPAGPLGALPLELAFFGFFLNLFNLLPFGILDGGAVWRSARWLRLGGGQGKATAVYVLYFATIAALVGGMVDAYFPQSRL